MHAFPLHQSIFWCFSSFLEFYSCFTHHACLFHLLASSLTWFFFSLTTQQFIYINIYIYIYICITMHHWLFTGKFRRKKILHIN
jgi:hypothetical protein